MVLSEKLIADIKNYQISYWQEIYCEELFERYIEKKEEKLKEMSFEEVKNEWKKEMKDSLSSIEELEADLSNKEDYIDSLIEWYDGSEDEFTDYCVNVYMGD